MHILLRLSLFERLNMRLKLPHSQKRTWNLKLEWKDTENDNSFNRSHLLRSKQWQNLNALSALVKLAVSNKNVPDHPAAATPQARRQPYRAPWCFDERAAEKMEIIHCLHR